MYGEAVTVTGSGLVPSRIANQLAFGLGMAVTRLLGSLHKVDHPWIGSKRKADLLTDRLRTACPQHVLRRLVQENEAAGLVD
jgi:hypothetical protein